MSEGEDGGHYLRSKGSVIEAWDVTWSTDGDGAVDLQMYWETRGREQKRKSSVKPYLEPAHTKRIHVTGCTSSCNGNNKPESAWRTTSVRFGGLLPGSVQVLKKMIARYVNAMNILTIDELRYEAAKVMMIPGPTEETPVLD